MAKYLIYRGFGNRYHYIAADLVEGGHLDEIIATRSTEVQAHELVTELNNNIDGPRPQ